MLPRGCGGGNVLSIVGVGGCSRDLQLAAVGGKHQVQGGQFEHTLHPGHRKAAEADLGRLENNTKSISLDNNKACC